MIRALLESDTGRVLSILDIDDESGLQPENEPLPLVLEEGQKDVYLDIGFLEAAERHVNNPGLTLEDLTSG
jgi:hypothetical protein